ncbi:hypothetical protein [Acetobacter sp.]|uniref:hypothetical protein n=1 Tax=Acetobacter sp. TaxID=440 RepID=UPI0039E86333
MTRRLLVLLNGIGCIGPIAASAQTVNLEQRHLSMEDPCSEVTRLLKAGEPTDPDTARANQRWWDSAMAAGGMPSYHIQYDHYRIIDDFFDSCRTTEDKSIRNTMRDIGLAHRWIIPGESSS